MSDDKPRAGGQASPEENRAMEALRGWTPPRAPEAVYQAARQAFLHGEPFPAAVDEPSPGRRNYSPILIFGLAAAAALALVLFGVAPVDYWRVAEVTAPEGIRIHGSQVRPGMSVRGGDIEVAAGSDIELRLGERLRFRLLPETEATLPKPPGRWFGRECQLSISHGEAFGASAGPLGFRFRLVTPEATATLTGTSFAVIRRPEWTCFCLYRGHLDIRLAAGGAHPDLPIEHRIVIPVDGGPPRIEPITDRERMKLRMLEPSGP